MRGISWPAENLLDSQEGFCSMQLVQQPPVLICAYTAGAANILRWRINQ